MFEAETLSVHVLALKIFKCHVSAAELMNSPDADLALKIVHDCVGGIFKCIYLSGNIILFKFQWSLFVRAL